MNEKNLTVKDKIKMASVNLLSEKSYMDITVTDVAKKAGVARVSFYRNFSSVAEVFDDIANDIFDELVSEILPVLKSNDEEGWRKLLTAMFYRFPKHHSLKNGKRPENIEELFIRISARLPKTADTDKTISEKYIPFGKIGLIVNIIKQWMAKGKKESPEEMVDYIMTFITKF